MTTMTSTDTERYTGPGRKGVNRALTPEETRDWKSAVANWHTSRPWTEQVLADNAKVRALLVHLYEDGVSLTDLADTAGWGYPQAAGVLRRAREEGRATGSRRYIAPTRAAKPAKDPFRRHLTEQELDRLTAYSSSVPRRPNGTMNWKTEEANTLLGFVDEINTGAQGTPVSLDPIAAVLGMSRQGLHQHLTRYRSTQQDVA